MFGNWNWTNRYKLCISFYYISSFSRILLSNFYSFYVLYFSTKIAIGLGVGGRFAGFLNLNVKKKGCRMICFRQHKICSTWRKKVTWNIQIVVKYVILDIKHKYDITWNMVVDTCDGRCCTRNMNVKYETNKIIKLFGFIYDLEY